MTNDLARENEGCLDLVKDTRRSIDSKNCDDVFVPARKSLETPAIVMANRGKDLLCYFPGEDKLCRLCEIPAKYRRFNKFFPCEGKLYSSTGVQLSSDMVRYSPYTNSWMQLPSVKVGKYLWKTFIGNEDKMYALLSGGSKTQVAGRRSQVTGHRSQVAGHRSQVAFRVKSFKRQLINNKETFINFNETPISSYCIL